MKMSENKKQKENGKLQLTGKCERIKKNECVENIT